MTDVTDRTDGQTDTDRMLQKEVLNQEIYTEGRNISIDINNMTEVRKESQRFNPHVFPCSSQHLNHVLLILCPPQTHHVHKTLKCFPCSFIID